jgi:hypothetical protein
VGGWSVGSRRAIEPRAPVGSRVLCNRESASEESAPAQQQAVERGFVHGVRFVPHTSHCATSAHDWATRR